ncbi:hypothetical protein LMG31841_05372 [Paraburkholderia saeva]|uniref:Uncharacterized protein n=1 Tax=Paraburkholderia saeva TaxID=2777537 RepID=A0A9N8X5L1_9BURK|nr:hypothetical protein LMG31841_05372 [Paraburkholderia saeva]
MQQALFAELLQHRRQTPCVIEVFHQILAGRLQVHEARHVRTEFPVFERQLHADALRERDQMNDRIRRAANRRIRADRVFKGLAREDPVHRQVFTNHVDDAAPGQVREHLTARIDRRNRGVMRQTHAERLDHRGHRRRRAHRHAVSARAVHARFGFGEFFLCHRAGAYFLRHLPDARARADGLAAKAAVQHRAAGDRQRGQVARCRAHQQRRRRLVATDEQDHAIHRIAANRFFDIHRCEIAEQHCSRAQIGFPQ